MDFVYKQRAEAGRKWALRNAKLRMSRKLVFASGLLRCFFCHLDADAADARKELDAPEHNITKLLKYMEGQLVQTPLELLARAASRPAIEGATARRLFDSHDGFLAVLDDEEKRKALDKMAQADMVKSPVWREIRRLSHNFHRGLLELFFGKDRDLRRLGIEYAVF